jgi:hypothetical protein
MVKDHKLWKLPFETFNSPGLADYSGLLSGKEKTSSMLRINRHSGRFLFSQLLHDLDVGKNRTCHSRVGVIGKSGFLAMPVNDFA